MIVACRRVPGRLRAAALVGGAVLAMTAMGAASFAHPPVKLTIEQEKVAAEEVADFRKKVAAAAAAKSATALRDHYADGFVHIAADGTRVLRDAYLAALLAGTPAIETVKAEDVSIKVPGGWTAVATGLSLLPVGEAGAPAPVAWTIVYIRTEKSWQLVASQATRITALKQ